MGEAKAIDKVIVSWPGGEVEQFTGCKIDHRYRLVQGEGKASAALVQRRETKLAPSVQKVQQASQSARIPLVELLVAPKSPYTDFEGGKHELDPERGRFLLVNLWASWCAPCQEELNAFSQRYDELQAKGVDILALSVDGLGQDPSTRSNAAKLVASRKFPFAVGEATDALVSDFQNLHNLHVPLHEDLPLPSSFLIDKQGRLAVIYKGAVSVDVVMADTAHRRGTC